MTYNIPVSYTHLDVYKRQITYFLDVKDLDDSVELLLKTSDVVKARFPNGINKVAFDDKNIINRIPFRQFSITKSTFKQVIADVSYIEDFKVEMATRQLKQSIVTLYNTCLLYTSCAD